MRKLIEAKLDCEIITDSNNDTAFVTTTWHE